MASNNEQEKYNTDTPQQGHNSAAGKKVDADVTQEQDRPEEEGNLVTQESQKGKKVDADPETEQPTTE